MIPDQITVSCVQLCSGRHVETNLQTADRYIRHAVQEGASLVSLPENALLLEDNTDMLYAQCHEEEQSPALARMQSLASELQCWLHLGSMAMRDPNIADGRVRNRTYVIGPDGTIAARYDKIHLFDAALGPEDTTGGRYQESSRYAPGDSAVIAPTPWGGFGLTICYDLRFPQLYRTLAQHGVRVIMAPAAFTKVTGQAHWHVLLRARAIETGCFIIAAAQSGRHECGRETYGHSLIISPWGEVIADAGTDTGVISATLDLTEVESARQRINSLITQDFRIEPGQL